MAIARVSCASRLNEPSDIAPVTKRLTISLAGSTSSRASHSASGSSRNFSSPRRGGCGATQSEPLGLGQLAELQQPAQRRPAARVLVDELGVLVVGRLPTV